MKKILIITLIFLTGCTNWMSKESEKTGKANSATTRINNSDSNGQNIFKELDE